MSTCGHIGVWVDKTKWTCWFETHGVSRWGSADIQSCTRVAGAPEENCDRRQILDWDYANDGIVRKPGEEEVTRRTSLLGKKAGWNRKWMVRPKSGGVRFGIVRVVKSVKNRIKDKKVRDGSISHGNSEAIGRFQSGDEDMRSALKLTEAWTGREQTPRGKRKDTAV